MTIRSAERRETAVSGAPGTAGAWSAWVDEVCGAVSSAGRWRRPVTFDADGPSGLLEEEGAGRVPVVSFASNDYLGLAGHPAVAEAARAAIDRWGTGSGASRLVTGSRPVHRQLEEALAAWKGSERAVLFPTGFSANLAVLSVFGTEGSVIVSDSLNHASIVDGCRLARAPVVVYPHGNLGGLDRALGGVPGRAIVVSDTVFSMDGDVADLDGLLSVAARHDALVVLDEAHAVLGPDLPPAARGRGPVVLRVGTLSKTLGSLGGFVCGPAAFCDLVVNRGRPYIFTTAPTPADAAAALCALAIVESTEGDERRARLLRHLEALASATGVDRPASPIVPVVVGDEDRAVAASRRLLDDGLWVPAIRPPTVPVGTSRLRVTLSAAHTDEQVGRLGRALTGLVPSGRRAT